MNKRIHMQCSTQVKRNAVSRREIDGAEHIIVSSYTLPDNVVMNGGLYPADEIEKGYRSLERTLAPIEHPVDTAGNWLSANDPLALHNHYAGAFNENVRRENGRVHVDKVINVQEALKSERGRRLLNRVKALEANENVPPIHTSTGLMLEVEELSEPQTNAAGDEYTWIARNMTFDHDAILLDSIGAAQPSQGVGMAVNGNAAVERFTLNEGDDMSHEELEQRILDALQTPPLSADYITRVFPTYTVYVLGGEYFKVPYTVGNGTVTISGLPLPVERDESFVPKTNQEGNAMKTHMLNKLKAAGVTVNAEATDEEILSQYDALQANQTNDSGDNGASDDNTADLAAVVANALAPVVARLDSFETKLNADADAERDTLAETVGNSDKYAGIDAAAAKALPIDTLKAMAANCQPSFGVPINAANSEGTAAFDMPE